MLVFVLFLYFSGRVFFYVAQAQDLICCLITIRECVKDTTVISINLVLLCILSVYCTHSTLIQLSKHLYYIYYIYDIRVRSTKFNLIIVDLTRIDTYPNILKLIIKSVILRGHVNISHQKLKKKNLKTNI